MVLPETTIADMNAGHRLLEDSTFEEVTTHN